MQEQKINLVPRAGSKASGGVAEGEKLNGEGGVIMVGTKGKVICNTYGLGSRLLPDSLHKSVGDPPRTLERITTSHETNWSNACKGVGKASTPFEYGAKLTEVMLLGVVAMRATPLPKPGIGSAADASLSTPPSA